MSNLEKSISIFITPDCSPTPSPDPLIFNDCEQKEVEPSMNKNSKSSSSQKTIIESSSKRKKNEEKLLMSRRQPKVVNVDCSKLTKIKKEQNSFVHKIDNDYDEEDRNVDIFNNNNLMDDMFQLRQFEKTLLNELKTKKQKNNTNNNKNESLLNWTNTTSFKSSDYLTFFNNTIEKEQAAPIIIKSVSDKSEDHNSSDEEVIVVNKESENKPDAITIDINDYWDADQLHDKISELFQIKYRCDSSTLSMIQKKLREKVSKPILLYGPPGCGKSQMVKHLIQDTKTKGGNENYRIIDLSDKLQELFDQLRFDNHIIDRKQVSTAIRDTMYGTLCCTNFLFEHSPVVIMDEMDNYPENWINMLFTKFVPKMKHHLICICNDPFMNSSISKYRTKCELIRMKVISPSLLYQYLQKVNSICGSPLTASSLTQIVENANGDFRGTLNNYIFYAKSNEPIKQFGHLSAQNVTSTSNNTSIFTTLHALRYKPISFITSFIENNPFLTVLIQLNYEKYFEKQPILLFSDPYNNLPTHYLPILSEIEANKYNTYISSGLYGFFDAYIIYIYALILKTLKTMRPPSSLLSFPKPRSSYLVKGTKETNKYKFLGAIDEMNTKGPNQLIKLGHPELINTNDIGKGKAELPNVFQQLNACL